MQLPKTPSEWARELRDVATAQRKVMRAHLDSLRRVGGIPLPPTWTKVREQVAAEVQTALGARYMARERMQSLGQLQRFMWLFQENEQRLKKLRRSIQSKGLLEGILHTFSDSENLATSASAVEMSIIAQERARAELGVLERRAARYQKSLKLDSEPMVSLLATKKDEVDSRARSALADRDQQVAELRATHDSMEESVNQLALEVADLEVLADFRSNILIDEDPSRKGRPLIPPSLRLALLAARPFDGDHGLSAGGAAAVDQIESAVSISEAPNP